MAIYSVHLPPGVGPEVVADRAVFVREGFSVAALVVAPVWFLWHREWTGLIGWLVVTALLTLASGRLDPATSSGLTLVFAVAVAIAANDIRRLTFLILGWTDAGVVEGSSRATAERRFFDAWLARQPAASTVAPLPAPSRPQQRLPSGILGLFPDSGAR